MDKTRFGEIVSAFSAQDFKELHKFAESPFFNRNKQVTKLSELLFTVKHESGSSEIPKEEMWRYVYGPEGYNDDKFLKLTSDFVKLAEKYFCCKKNDSDIVRNKIFLLETFREMKLEKNFTKYYKELEQYFDKEYNRNADYFLYKYSFLSEALLCRHTEEGYDIISALDELNDTAGNGFLLIRLDNMIQGLISAGREICEEELLPVEKKIKDIKKSSPLAYGKYLVIKMLTAEEGKEFFYELKSLVTDNVKLNKANKRFFYDKLLIYCDSAQGKNSGFKQEELEIHKAMDAEGLIPAEGTYLGYNAFLKTVSCALNFGELEWSEKFIKKYAGKLSPEFAGNTVNLALADVNICLKKFDEALNALSFVDTHNSFFYLAKNLKTIIIYYEQGERDAANSAIDAVKHYLSRNKQKITGLYDYYNNFLNFTSRLLRNGKVNRSLIKNDLERAGKVANRVWLESKV
jgi:hypothetical protein